MGESVGAATALVSVICYIVAEGKIDAGAVTFEQLTL
jgi:hypothetical protein